MHNNMIQILYEAAKSDTQFDENGMPKMDEQKLRRALKNNDRLGRRNRDIFAQGEPKFHTCPRYDPCPLCDKCMNKASHLFKACETCQIPVCSHSYADRDKMIKRKNFTILVSKEVMDDLEETYREVCGNARG